MPDRDLTSEIIRGKVWVITDSEGRFIDDIDTDMIFHNKYLAITELERMGQYTFDNLDGWQDFSVKVKAGDILVVGRNFGSGSSRQQAVDCFRALGIALIVGVSFGAIYWRNAVNSGLPIIKAPSLSEDMLASGDEIEVELLSGRIKNLTRTSELPPAIPFSRVQWEIYRAGGLFNFARGMER